MTEGGRPTEGETTMEAIERLRAAWQAARTGRGGVIHLEGPIGCGKSTLLGRFLDAVGAPSERVVVVSARCGEHDRLRPGGRGVVEDLVVRVAEGVRAIEVAQPGDDADDREVPWLLPGADFVTAATAIASLPGGRRDPTAPTRAAVHAGLLLDVARARPVLLALDDVHRADDDSKRLVEALARGVSSDPTAPLLLVLTTTSPADADGPYRPAGEPEPVPPLPREQVAALVQGRVGRIGEARLDAVVEVARGNPLVAEALVRLAERTGSLDDKDDPPLRELPGFAGLDALARGALPTLPADVRADIQTAAVVGRRFEATLLAKLWAVPPEAARLRIAALCATGLVAPEGARWAFLSDELAARLADALPADERATLHGRIASLLRAGVRTHDPEAGPRPFLDVTDTWSETQRRERQERDELDTLAAAAAHFAGAGRHARAAEAGVTLVERLFDTGTPLYLAGRFGRRADRERRHRIYAALTEAVARLEAARVDVPPGDLELLAIHVRLLTVRARFKEALGDFAEAGQCADAAVELARHLPDPRVRLEAMRVRVEVCYAAGHANAAREVTVQLVGELDRAPSAEALRVLRWLSEAVGRWEWTGLHARLYPYVIDRLQALGGHKEALCARLEWMAAALDDPTLSGPDRLIDDAIDEAREHGLLPYLAEQLARHAAELIQMQVDIHFDQLSGEFYPPDLFDESEGEVPELTSRLERPVALMKWAESLAAESDSRVSLLRVMTTALSVVYESRERFGELLERWLPVHGGEGPLRLTELGETLEHGFFSVEQVEALAERVVLLADELELAQVVGDTLQDALDRDLPGMVRRADSVFPRARAAYEAVGDVYGLITLMLVQIRHQERRELDPIETLGEGLAVFEEHADELTTEQRAFVHLRYGELLLDRDTEAAIEHLEQAIHLYDQVGDVEHVQVVGDILRELYRKKGDLNRYRALRERFRALEFRSPGVDPLGLELRIEHLLTLARGEADDERAIEMVERCVQLFGRIPDGTTRIDECFVEISKICRRRADEAETEAGFADWRRRSLDAVRIAAGINQRLGNFHRVFEEFHELFDDLLSLGAYDDYLRTRAEGRALAFAVGHVGELLYLFDEHLQYDPEGGGAIWLPEVRAFYEALLRYLLGLGALEAARKIQNALVAFLTALGEEALAEHYRRPLGPATGM